MARPLKEGLDYFSLDCYMDSKIKLIQAEYGLKGFAIVVKLWQMIYREHGYYSEWNDEKALLFAYEECSDCGVKLLNEIVETCFRRDIFSEKLFRKYRILTSSGIQKRYFLAVDRRRKNEVNITAELKEKKWVKAVVEHIPEHERFVRFRLHFTNMYGENSSYVESYTMSELTEMMKSGELVRA